MKRESTARSNSYIYPLLSLIPVVVHILINLYLDILPVRISLIDGFVSGLLLSISAIGVWYVVKYNPLHHEKIFQNISTHLAALTLITFSAYYTAQLILSLWIGQADYSIYFKTSGNIRILIGIFYYLLLTSLFYLYHFYHEMQLKQLREIGMKKQLRDAELLSLKSQINPHFIFNSLNSISSLTMIDPIRANEMVIALSDFLRYVLRFGQEEKVMLGEELSHIDRYLQIEKIRFGNLLNYRLEVEPECRSCFLPNLLLQPLIENAIKYGVYEASEPVSIDLTAQREDGMMVIRISNDFDPESTPAKGEGIGIKNIRERLRLVYTTDSLLQIRQEASRFIATIHLPIETTPE